MSVTPTYLVVVVVVFMVVDAVAVAATVNVVFVIVAVGFVVVVAKYIISISLPEPLLIFPRKQDCHSQRLAMPRPACYDAIGYQRGGRRCAILRACNLEKPASVISLLSINSINMTPSMHFRNTTTTTTTIY